MCKAAAAAAAAAALARREWPRLFAVPTAQSLRRTKFAARARLFGCSAAHEPVDVAIIGGGIGGVALALALARSNHSLGEDTGHRLAFKAFEKDVSCSARKQGYGLTLNRGWSALERLDLAEDAREEDTPSSAHYIFDASGGAESLWIETRQHSASWRLALLTPASHALASPISQMPDLLMPLLCWPQLAPSPYGAGLVNVFSSKDFGRTRASSSSSAAKQAANLWERRRNLIIPRQRLRELLLAKLSQHDDGAEAVEWGWAYASHAQRADGRIAVQLQREGEGGTVSHRTLAANVLVGADGVWSRVREQSLCDARVGDSIEYLGVLVVLGIAPCSHPLCEGNTFQVLDGATRLYSMPFSVGASDAERQTFWQLSFVCDEAEARRYRCAECHVPPVPPPVPSPVPLPVAPTAPPHVPPPSHHPPAIFPPSSRILCSSHTRLSPPSCHRSDDTPALLDEIRRRCGRWHEPMPSLFASTPPDRVTAYPVYERGESFPFPATQPGMATRSGAVTLIGDAAHPMSPFKAQGANQALMDAVALADALAATSVRGGGAAASLREFELQMHARSEPQRLRSRAAVAALHSADLSVAAATGKDGRPSDELRNAFRSACIGCWDAEQAPQGPKASRRLRTRLDQKIVEALKAVRRSETRRRVRQRESRPATARRRPTL